MIDRRGVRTELPEEIVALIRSPAQLEWRETGTPVNGTDVLEYADDEFGVRGKVRAALRKHGPLSTDGLVDETGCRPGDVLQVIRVGTECGDLRLNDDLRLELVEVSDV